MAIRTKLNDGDNPEDYSIYNSLVSYKMLANDLRAPITIINNNLEKIKLKNNATISKDIENIDFAANSLNQFISSFIYLLSYNNRQLKLSLKKTKIIDIYDKVKEQIALMAKLRKVKIHVSILPNLNYILSDIESMSLVLYNLSDYLTKKSTDHTILNIRARAIDGIIEIEFEAKKFYFSENNSKDLSIELHQIDYEDTQDIGLLVSKILVEANKGKIDFYNHHQDMIIKLNIPITA